MTSCWALCLNFTPTSSTAAGGSVAGSERGKRSNPASTMDGWMDGYLELSGGLIPGTQARGSGCSTSQPAPQPPPARWPLRRIDHGTDTGTNTGTGAARPKILALTSSPQKARHLGFIHCINTEAVAHRVCHGQLTYIHSQFTIHFVYFTTLCLFVFSIALCLLFAMCTCDHHGYFLPRAKVVNSAKSP